MTRVVAPLDHPALEVRGALEVDRRADSLSFRRLPAWTRGRTPEPAFELMASMTSGVRLAFHTRADALEIEILETGLQFAGEPRRPATVDVVVDGRLAGRRTAAAGHTIVVDGAASSLKPGAASRLRFEGLGVDPKEVEIWLPQAAMTRVAGLTLENGDLDAPRRRKPRWIHYGSSISHGMEAGGPSETWPGAAARSLGLDLINLGFAGQCMLDAFVARSIAETPCDLISLKLGANIVGGDIMRRRAFAEAVHGFLDWIRAAQPQTPILLISPIWCRLLEDGPGPAIRRAGPVYERLQRSDALSDGALTLKEVRRLLAALAKARQDAGDPRLVHLDGLDLFGDADEDGLIDGLHPGPAAALDIAERFAGAVRRRSSALTEPVLGSD